MPIALPPPLPPMQGSAEVIQQQGSAYVTAAVQGVNLHVIGPNAVSQSDLEAAITASQSMSDAVRLVQGLYYAAGYPGVQVTYALVEPDLYVLVKLGAVSKVEAPAPYDRYLAGVAGAEPLTDDALEPGRTLASLHADRAGQTATPSFIADEAGSMVLRVEPHDGAPKRSFVGAEFGNPGNRFVGRHFLDYFATTSLTTGDEFRATGRHVLEGLSDDRGAKGYHEHSLGWSRVTPWGLFGLSGRYVGYQQNLEIPGFPDLISFDGDIRQAELGWTYLLAADFTSRWTIGAKADYTRKDFSVTESDESVQRQEYGSAEISTDYTTALRPLGVQTELGGSIAVRSGLGDDETDDPFTAADLGYLLYRPTLSARAYLHEWLTLSLVATGQITSDALPEQQQWVMGGVGNVEAYLPGVASGDTGGIARLQFELKGLTLGAATIKPRLFAEYGVARFEEAVFGQPTGTQAIGDGGVSLVMGLGPNFEAAVSYAESFSEEDIDQEILDDADANVFFRVGAKF
ncbi:ShlB/FhaC/HecB family hemolysin secretion/activation protein [Panacagrimonas sp.]|uniref:ShlB/FhaC/HecB family hemolysin secretion/activation protein n=1 Tax=Panacagrimonas sp. TaxID=2480088 RepID=UPI003B527C64